MMTKNFYYTFDKPSSLPIMSSISVFNLTTSIFLKLNNMNSFMNMLFNLFNMIILMMLWWHKNSVESTMGSMTDTYKTMVTYSFMIFILSEVMLFLCMFWLYLHLLFNPSTDSGMSWPPMNISKFDWFKTPMMNTFILLSSSGTVTLAHEMLHENKYNKLNYFIMLIFSTILLGITFSILQMYEYKESMYSFSDSAFGNSFFMTTGLHGLHVIVGTFFLIYTMIMIVKEMYSMNEFIMFDMSAWYWHFVDTIWIFVLYFFYYIVF